MIAVRDATIVIGASHPPRSHLFDRLTSHTAKEFFFLEVIKGNITKRFLPI